MSFKFPKDINEASDPAFYKQLQTVGLCRQLLGYALTTLHQCYGKVENFEFSDSDATAQFISTLNDVRSAIEAFYKGDLSVAGEANAAAGEWIQKRTLQLQSIAVSTAFTIGQATGESWAEFLTKTSEYAVHTVAGDLIPRIADAAKAALDLPRAGLGAAQNLLDAIGWIGWVLVIGMAFLILQTGRSVAKRGGKVNAGPVNLST